MNMKPHRRSLVAFATLLTAVSGCNSNNGSDRVQAATTAPTTQPLVLDRQERRDAEQMRKALSYLASDELEGRGVQTDGLNKAAEYLAATFKSAGLKPLPGLDGYYQSFPINISSAVGPDTSLTVGEQACKVDQDFAPMGLSSEGPYSGQVVFVGYSISSDQFKYDDFADVDVKGKIALAMRYEPTDDSGKSRFTPDGRSDQATFSAKAKAAADHGALALLIVNTPDDSEADQLASMQRSGGAKASIPVIQVTRVIADQILKSGGSRDLASLHKQIDSTGRPQSSLLRDIIVSGQVDLKQDQREIRNVVAYVPGVGPNKDEYIVVGAHYDHLGRGEGGSLSLLSRKEIHNGADDNASGTVAMLQIARYFAGKKPARSIIFCAFTGEERGLLGSAHFVNHPPVPLEKIVAMVNLDMVGRLKGNSLEIGGTGTAADFDAIVAAADKQSPLRLKTAASRVGGRGGKGPSDHASFAAKKIPVLFLWTGNHVDYHRPTDDTDKINFEGMTKIVEAAEQIINALTTWAPTQYVDKFDTGGMAMGSMRVRLGIMPDYSDEDAGVKVGSTFPDTPAAKAGIKDGDVIVQIGEDKVLSLSDYMAALNKHKPGDTVKLGVMRNGQRIEMDATFTTPRRG